MPTATIAAGVVNKPMEPGLDTSFSAEDRPSSGYSVKLDRWSQSISINIRRTGAILGYYRHLMSTNLAAIMAFYTQVDCRCEVDAGFKEVGLFAQSKALYKPNMEFIFRPK